MAQIRELTIRCGFCGTKFHSRDFTDTTVLEAALLAGHTDHCPKCGKDILCNKANTTWVIEESGGGGGIDFTTD
jgi:hypothetical protein